MGISISRITYQYGPNKGFIYVSQESSNRWLWTAGGNNGEEDSLNKAVQAAKDWITDNYNKKEN